MPTVDTPLRILIDTNIFIAAEGDLQHQHVNAGPATQLYRDANQLGHSLCLAAGVRDDFSRIQDEGHRRLRTQQLQRYHVLDLMPVPAGFQARAGYPPAINAQSQVDLTLLLALERNAVQWLVTEDQRILPHARALGLQDRVFTLSDALDLLAGQRHAPVPIPAVDTVSGYAIDPADPIFDGFPAEYAIRDWIRVKVAPEHRPCLVMYSPDSSALDAVAILKPNETDNWGLDGRVLKICTFKVADHAKGVRRGELLLWAVFEHARQNHCDAVFVEVFGDRPEVLDLFSGFGFEVHGQTEREGELVLAKRLTANEVDAELNPLDYNIRLGPGALRPDRYFVVPIVPIWHTNLFPVVNETGQLSLINELTVQGNAICKAYVCRAPSNQLAPGDTVLFLRTHEDQKVLVIGVVEETLRSDDPTGILTFTGQRTVYTPGEIDEMCQLGGVLAIRFRLDRVLDTPLTSNDLIAHQVMKRSPQSVQLVRDQDAITWLNEILSD